MKAELFPFQKKALSQLRLMAGEAINGYQRTHSNQVVSFTAPTGAGKTIIMASLIEEIFFGGVDYEEQPPFFKLSDTHYAATWLLHPNAPKVEMPETLKNRIARMKQKREEV